MWVKKRFWVRQAPVVAVHGVTMGLSSKQCFGHLGPNGAGKTTLTRGIGEGLGVRGPVTSPTFVLARTHPSLVDGPPLVHVDAYRLNSAVELDDLDIDFAHSVVVVEWGAGMMDGLVDSWLDVVIERPEGANAGELGDELVEPRTVTITGHGDRWVA